VRLYYTFQDESSLYFVLDYAANGELLSLIKRTTSLNEECTKYYGAQLLDAIDYMHNKGVVHRDLKPENILLDDKMRIKVTDFGTAKLMEPLKNPDGTVSDKYPEDVKAHSFVGTAEYVSPELLTDKATGKSSDFWAFGCILYQMLAGRPPFKAGNEYQTFQKIVKCQMSYPPGFPFVARDLIKRLLVVNPRQRLKMDQIKSHPFFEGVDWNDRKAIWKGARPKLQPYRPSAKSSNPMARQAAMPPHVPSTQVQPMAPRQIPNYKAMQQQYRARQEAQAKQSAHAAAAALAMKPSAPFAKKDNDLSPTNSGGASKKNGSNTSLHLQTKTSGPRRAGQTGPSSSTERLQSPDKSSPSPTAATPAAAAAASNGATGSAGGGMASRQFRSAAPVTSTMPGGFPNPALAAATMASPPPAEPVTAPAPASAPAVPTLTSSQTAPQAAPQTAPQTQHVQSMVLPEDQALPGHKEVQQQQHVSNTPAPSAVPGIPSVAVPGPSASVPTTSAADTTAASVQPGDTTQTMMDDEEDDEEAEVLHATELSGNPPRTNLDNPPLLPAASQLDAEFAGLMMAHDERILKLGHIYCTATSRKEEDEEKEHHTRLSKFFTGPKKKRRIFLVTTLCRALVVSMDDKRIRVEIDLMSPYVGIRDYPDRKNGGGVFALEVQQRVYYIEDSNGSAEWIRAISKAAEYGEFREIVAAQHNASIANAAAASAITHTSTTTGPGHAAAAAAAARSNPATPNINNGTAAFGSPTNAAQPGSPYFDYVGHSNAMYSSPQQQQLPTAYGSNTYKFQEAPAVPKAPVTSTTSKFLARNEERKQLRRLGNRQPS
jgi:3-phosphoinositide dependent protein kinase-1